VTVVRALAAEPLIQFALLGATLFLLFHVFHGRAIDDSTTITVTQGEITQLAETFRKLNQRAPSHDELQRMIDEFVRTVVLARQAIALGLDRDDVLIRRRLTQKLEFLLQSMAIAQAPTEEELRRFLSEHSERYWVDSKIAFRHIFYSRARRGLAAEATAHRRLGGIEAEDAQRTLDAGDSFLLGDQFPLTARTEVARDFGGMFAEALDHVPLQHWSGPVESSFGWHLVFVSARVPRRLPPLAEIREAVTRDWSAAHAQSYVANEYRQARAHYTVLVEAPRNQ
jgi:hypothetical protein